MKALGEEEKHYQKLPKFYVFKNEKEKREVLDENFRRIRQEVRLVCEKVMAENGLAKAEEDNNNN